MIKCDKCNHVFEIKLKTKCKDDIETTYFECPSCGATYITLKTDAKLRKLLQKAQNLLMKAQKNKKYMTAYLQAVEEVKKYSKDANLEIKH